MKTEDARSLSAKAQEALRRRVVQAVREGLTQAEAARLFGVARGTVNGWMGLWEREGSPGLKAGRRGRPPCPRLAPPQAATTVRLILSRCPDQLRLPFALWTREAVQQLLARRFGVHVSGQRSEEHTSELQSPCNLVCRLLLEKKKQSST